MYKIQRLFPLAMLLRLDINWFFLCCFRNILCFPIKDDSEVVIGVAQLCNKIGGIGFSTFDLEIAQAFSVYCGISIMHVSVHFFNIFVIYDMCVHIMNLLIMIEVQNMTNGYQMM